MANKTQSIASFHTATSVKSSKVRIIVAVIFALLAGAAGIYTYRIGMWDSKPQPIVPNHRLPSPPPVPQRT
jgi:hypothetical protein